MLPSPFKIFSSFPLKKPLPVSACGSGCLGSGCLVPPGIRETSGVQQSLLLLRPKFPVDLYARAEVEGEELVNLALPNGSLEDELRLTGQSQVQK